MSYGLTVEVHDGTNDGPLVLDATVAVEPQLYGVNAQGRTMVDTLLITVQAPGYVPYERQPYHLTDPTTITHIALQKRATSPLPQIPSRARVCGVKETFQGLTVDTEQYGHIPWFEAAYVSLNDKDRAQARQVKRGAEDTHLELALAWNYQEPGYSYPVPGRDLTGDLPTYRALVEEVIRDGFIPVLRLAGDGTAPDPQGWTKGHDWLMANLEAILTALREPVDLLPYCLITPGYDGVFYGWSPDQVRAFLSKLRSLAPACHIGLEFSAGICHLGNGTADYTDPNGLQQLDVVMGEYDGPPNTDKLWQVSARWLGPAYRRPPDQPTGDDVSPPYYLGAGTPRGPFYAIGLEWREYDWVRGHVDLGTLELERRYIQTCGYEHVG